MIYIFKPGQGSKLSDENKSDYINRQENVRGIKQLIIETYDFYIDSRGAGHIDLGYCDFVQAQEVAESVFDHVVYWMARASGVELNSSELVEINQYFQIYAAENGSPFDGDTHFDFMEEVS